MAAARANWKGYLRLSLVSCPIALYPATSESEKVRFNQLNKNTGNRIRYSKVDAAGILESCKEGSESRLELDGDQDNPPWIKRSCGLNRTTAPGCIPGLSLNM